MSEIEKLYENVRLHKCTNIGNFCKHIGFTCERCKKHKYPPFTAEKQIELIKWLVKHRFNFMVYELNENDFTFEVINKRPKDFISLSVKDFAEGLAKVLNYLWQDLTEEGKQQIKEILK